MRNEFLETAVSRAGVASLVGGCREDSKSFIPVSVVRRESVSHASRTVCVFRGAECVVMRICGCVCVIVYVYVRFFYNNNNMPVLLAHLEG